MRLISLTILIATLMPPDRSEAAPTAQVAKRCVRYGYLAYPFKRPGSVKMSGDRGAYIKNCMEQRGDVPMPANSAPGK